MTFPRAAALAALDRGAGAEIIATFAALCDRLKADAGIATPDQEYATALGRPRNTAAVYVKMCDMIEEVFPS